LLFPSETGEGASIKGLWAMIDSQHGKEGMTSEFEMHFIQGIGKMTMDPVELMSGKYKGWFRLKRLTGNGTDKVEEKNVILNFSKAGEDGYTIKGEGSNRFGAFVLQGTLGVADNSVVMYRQYVVKAGTTPKGAGATAAAYAAPKKAPTPKSSFRPAAAGGVGVSSSPRDGAGRERKKSAVFDGDYAHEPKPGAKAKAATAANPRTQRLSQHLLKCGDLLKEMKKLPASVYFLEPVDPIKLNIPDYFTLVTTPMDFATIQDKLTAGTYAAPTNFAEDVRLVFKNAITYNQLRDNPVHIAAREMSHKFEEKYKSLHNAMTSKQSVSNAELAAFTSRTNRPAAASKPKSKGGGGGGGSRKSVGGAGGYGAIGMLPPDGSAIQIQEMHRQMLEMQSELMTLRQSVGQEAIMSAMDRQQEASQKPLTYSEKKDLIDSINRMEEEHMERIVNIIQESRATNGGAEGEEDIEVPLDELDTGTLRRLQAVVDEVMPGRKGKRALDEGGAKKEAAPVSRPQRQANPAKKARADDTGYAYSYNSAPPPAPQVGTVGPGMIAPPAPAAVPIVDGPSEDYGDMLQGGGGGGGGAAAVASADAWAAASSSSSQAATAVAASAGAGAGGDGSWNAAGAELQARQARDEQLKQEEGRLQQQRQQEESERAQALREAAMRQEQEQRLAQEAAQAEAAQAERDMQARREEERQQRLAQSGGAAGAVLDSSALLKQMESDDV
jgi:hypothetical protein